MPALNPWKRQGMLILAISSGATALSGETLQVKDTSAWEGSYLVAFKYSYSLSPMNITPAAGVHLSPEEARALEQDLTRQTRQFYTRHKQFNGTRNSSYRVKSDAPVEGNARIQLNGFLPGLETVQRLRQTFLPGGKVKLENVGPTNPALARQLASWNSLDLRLGVPAVHDLPLTPGQRIVNPGTAAESRFGGNAVVVFQRKYSSGNRYFTFSQPAESLENLEEIQGETTVRARDGQVKREGSFDLYPNGALLSLNEVIMTTFRLEFVNPQFTADTVVTARLERKTSP